jgi:hypothetical protein
MPYNPHVVNTAGASIAHGIDAASQAIAEGMKEHREAKMQNDYFTQQARDLSGRTGPDGQPLMTAEMLKQIETGNLSQKKAIVADALFNLNNSYQNLQAQQGKDMTTAKLAEMGAATQGQVIANRNAPQINQAQLDALKTRNQGLSADAEMSIAKLNAFQQFQRGPKMVQMPDPRTGQPFGMVQESPDSYIPMPGATNQPGGPPVTVNTPDGEMYWSKEGWKPWTGNQGANEIAKKNADRTAAIDQAIAVLKGKAAGAGKRLTDPQVDSNGKAGRTYQAEIDNLNVERAALLQANGAQSSAPAVQTPAPNAPPQFKAGDRVTQGGKQYEFDGSNWNEISQ